MVAFRARIDGAIFGVVMVALPLYCLLAAVGCGLSA